VAYHVMPGELHGLLERCRAEDAVAWERFAAWVTMRGRAILSAVDKLSAADGEDAVADTLTRLITVVRRGEISGASNAEIDAYVCTALRNRALNVLRGRTRRREVVAVASEVPNPDLSEGPALEQVPDEGPSQAARTIAAEQLGRAEKFVLSWSPEERYLFMAKLNGVSARLIQQTLERPPFECFSAVTTVDTRYHRLRKRLIDHIREAEP
jgi:DNA-directed RNA polymerase specialized sigma24 family protein